MCTSQVSYDALAVRPLAFQLPASCPKDMLRMPMILSLFTLASILWEVCSLWLLRRQVLCVIRHRGQVPPDFAVAVTLEEHRKAADYTIARAKAISVDGLIGL